MVSNRQHVVKYADRAVDDALTTFIADVVELGGLFCRLADGIARQQGHTQTVWYALSVFSDGSLTVSQAARRLGTTRQALQRTANDLIARGLAAARPNPDHRTSPLVELTPSGRKVLDEISTAAARERRRWFSDEDVAAVGEVHAQVHALRDRLRSQLGPAPQS